MYEIIIQRAVTGTSLPTTPSFKRWVKTVLKNKMPSAELTIRIVDKNEMTELNTTYRKKNKPTNVLSFPFDMPEECKNDLPILGDIVICAEVIQEEAYAQKKTLDAHWAHMVVHGTLHLLGYDHENDSDAEIMEAEEIRFLSDLGFENPY
jgi:probable rRNA maturation factor